MTTSPRAESPSNAKGATKAAAAVGAAPDTVPTVGGFFLPRRQLGRLLALVAVVPVAMYFGDSKGATAARLLPGAATVHLLCFCSWFGCSMWVSFVAGLVMFHNLPRHVFGRLQAALFPRYFQYSILFVAGLLVNDIARCYLQGSSTSFGLDFGQRASFCAVLAILLVNLMFFEPRTTKVMYERHVVERRLGTGHEIGQLKPSDPEKANDPELVKLTKKFGALHGASTSLNLLALCLGIWHVCWLAARMH